MKLNAFKRAHLLFVVALAGCAGASVSQETQNASLYGTAPSQIVVYPFATNPSEVTLNQSIFQSTYRDMSGDNVDAQQQQIAHETAQNVCLEVVTALTQKGFNALCQQRGTPPGAG